MKRQSFYVAPLEVWDNRRTRKQRSPKKFWQICDLCLEDSWSEYRPGHGLEVRDFPRSIQANSRIADPP